MYRMSSALEIFLVMRYINVRFTDLLTTGGFGQAVHMAGRSELITGSDVIGSRDDVFIMTKTV